MVSVRLFGSLIFSKSPESKIILQLLTGRELLQFFRTKESVFRADQRAFIELFVSNLLELIARHALRGGDGMALQQTVRGSCEVFLEAFEGKCSHHAADVEREFDTALRMSQRESDVAAVKMILSDACSSASQSQRNPYMNWMLNQQALMEDTVVR